MGRRQQIAMLEGYGDDRPAPVTSGMTPLAFTEFFNYQSYFDTALREQAIGVQNPGEPIVGSTKARVPQRGIGFTLAHWSETPVVVNPFFMGKSGGNNPMILAPGESFFPGETFESFDWGLPFGWLGGGYATLLVHTSDRAGFVLPSKSPEILFHRQRALVQDIVTNPNTVVKPNWPIRFGWAGAIRSTVVQAGRPQINVEPTRTIVTLRTIVGAGAMNIRTLLYGSEDIALNNLQAIDVTSAIACDDLTFSPPATQYGAAGLAPQYQSIELTSGPLVRFKCEAPTAGVVFMDATGIAALHGIEIDIARYGRI